MNFHWPWQKPEPATRYVDDPRNYISERVYMDPTCGCWIWLQAVDAKGYGRCHIGKESRSYRAAYVAYRGPIPDGIELHHRCRNTFCVNPFHLDPVTPAEHAALESQRYEKFAAKPFCKNGHPRTPDRLYIAPKSEGSRLLRRDCRECQRERSQKRRAAKRAAP